MKKILTASLAAVLLLLAAGCEKVIEFKGEVLESRLTLSCCARAGEPLTAYVASSVFFLADKKAGAVFTDGLDTLRGTVRCFVNGENTPRPMRLDRGADGASLCYRADYSPAPGDHIRLEADFPGFGPVWAETAVPLRPAIEVLSARLVKADLGAWGGFFDEVEDTFDLEITLAVTDDGTYDKYYFLEPVALLEDDGSEELFPVHYGFSSNDILFRQMNRSDAMSLLAGDGGRFFSDALIKGQCHSFTITVSSVTQWELDSMASFGLEMATANEALYWYDYSYQQSMFSAGGLFAEGVTLYSNVNGGYGYFGAAVPVWLEVEW